MVICAGGVLLANQGVAKPRALNPTAARPRRRGDRIGDMSAIGTKRTSLVASAHVRFWG